MLSAERSVSSAIFDVGCAMTGQRTGRSPQKGGNQGAVSHEKKRGEEPKRQGKATTNGKDGFDRTENRKRGLGGKTKRSRTKKKETREKQRRRKTKNEGKKEKKEKKRKEKKKKEPQMLHSIKDHRGRSELVLSL